MENEKKSENLFLDLAADDTPTEIESLCMNCHEQGVTRLLLTKIPFFREIILMAFTCPHCGYRSNEIQSGGSIQEKGSIITLKVQKSDLNRQIVKSDAASIRIPEIDFEIPVSTQKGLLNTIEGFLTQSLDALREGQEERRKIDPETTARIDEFLVKLEKCTKGEHLDENNKSEFVFTIIVDDPTGNSYIENPNAPSEDVNMSISQYKRTPLQNFQIGLSSEETPQTQAMNPKEGGKEEEVNEPVEQYKLDFDKLDIKKQVMEFVGNCPNCNVPCTTRMFSIDIPYFKEVIVMASTCDSCGYKSSEVKTGGAISEKGKTITLKVTCKEDLSRDLLKSETATCEIPEKKFKITRGTLGGRFTTVEGLLVGIRDDLLKANPFLRGDSSQESDKIKFSQFLKDIEELSSGESPFTIIIDDPVSNSYIQSLTAPDPDPNLTVVEYERTYDQNDDLGLNDMNTENYMTEEQKKENGKEEVKKESKSE